MVDAVIVLGELLQFISPQCAPVVGIQRTEPIDAGSDLDATMKQRRGTLAVAVGDFKIHIAEPMNTQRALGQLVIGAKGIGGAGILVGPATSTPQRTARLHAHGAGFAQTGFPAKRSLQTANFFFCRG